ncbi:sialate O-acetylesterase [Aestuariibaculum lutulentum]|uniref:Sialate O-acetylesterase n=1 Tax=Aestuariibaculum lutulentum TaxID=2920935 RepID=A0ABS9RFE5_9FLAO|nr:sialate O-acetylesterase [Aestuariibaculum lutulentum]MCH4551672.1 sialate O-acetylesterase [Aestuariibaculum lutulentum]
MKNKIVLVIACVFSVFTLQAQIKLPALFSDHMMLQQQGIAPIWGWASKNESLKITTSWDNKVYEVKADKTGKWKTSLQTPAAGGPYTISVSNGSETKTVNNVLIGEVWLCSGQSNMEMPLKGFPGQPVQGGNEAIVHSNNKNIHFITVPRATVLEPKQDFEGGWQVASPKTTGDFSATAWYFGSLLQDVLDVPVGMIVVSYGGSNVEAWMNEEMLKDFDLALELPKNESDLKSNPNRVPTTLFNGMLSPVIGYGIKGAIWYQGESNYERSFQYKDLFKKMVTSWRELWNQGEFPFYFAQIAPFDYARFHPNDNKEEYNSAYLREAQLKASIEIPNSGMAVLLDVGEFGNIHPAQKNKGGERLAYQALAKTYGFEGFEFESPEFNAMEVKGSTVTVSFNNVPNGVTSYDKEVVGFEIAGENKVFYPAQAVLRRKSVLLSSPQVEKPVAVRYLFKDFTKAEIFSTGGLPMSSFRTDNW